jgi:hypothetical protein
MALPPRARQPQSTPWSCRRCNGDKAVHLYCSTRANHRLRQPAALQTQRRKLAAPPDLSRLLRLSLLSVPAGLAAPVPLRQHRLAQLRLSHRPVPAVLSVPARSRQHRQDRLHLSRPVVLSHPAHPADLAVPALCCRHPAILPDRSSLPDLSCPAVPAPLRPDLADPLVPAVPAQCWLAPVVPAAPAGLATRRCKARARL